METELLHWHERLDLLEKGKSLPVDNIQSVYSAIKNHFPTGHPKKFGVRTHPKTLKKRVIRIK